MHPDDEWDSLDVPQAKKEPAPSKRAEKKKPEERVKNIKLRFTKCCATCDYMSYLGAEKYAWCHYPERTIPKESMLRTVSATFATIMEGLGYHRTVMGLLCKNWESAPCIKFDRIEKNLNYGPLALPGDEKHGIIEDQPNADVKGKAKQKTRNT